MSLESNRFYLPNLFSVLVIQKILALIFLSIFCFNVQAQLDRDFFPLSREYKQWGLILSPELNVQVPFSNYKENVILNDSSNYDYSLEGKGKLGYGIELGAFYTFKQPSIFHFLEAGLGYRKLSSSTNHNGVLTVRDTMNQFQSINTSAIEIVHLSIRATHVTQLRRYSMLMNSIGINLNYAISEDYKRSSSYPTVDEKFTSNPSAQLHYQIGFAYRVSRFVVLSPSIETPLLTAYEFDGINTGFNYFNLKYQPFYLKLRIYIFQKDPVNCNAPTYQGPTGI